MATRMIETPILSPRAARRFSGVAFPCTTRGAQLVLASSPQMRSRARRNAAPARLLPRDVRDELRSKFGCHRPNIERMVRPIRFGGSIERMVYDEFWGCGRADCGLSYSPATRCGFRGRGPHSNRYRAGKGRRKAAAGEGAISRHAGVGAQRTQRHSGRSRACASLCKWTFLCTRRSS